MIWVDLDSKNQTVKLLGGLQWKIDFWMFETWVQNMTSPIIDICSVTMNKQQHNNNNNIK